MKEFFESGAVDDIARKCIETNDVDACLQGYAKPIGKRCEVMKAASPKRKSQPNGYSKSWFDGECTEVKKALNDLKKLKTVLYEQLKVMRFLYRYFMDEMM
uniref:Uncharacterized protein n=1 Tax=Sphaerodactylus townsendi TaxID=933632 RepID=A0ACB8G791_9SAUR